jgi:hypothetical protein
MAKGDKDHILQAFTRLERFLTKIAGKGIFEFKNLQSSKQSDPFGKKFSLKPEPKEMARVDLQIPTITSNPSPVQLSPKHPERTKTIVKSAKNTE